LQDPKERIVFRQLVRKESGCCTYLMGAADRGEYLLVDPLMDYERFLPEMDPTQSKSRIEYIIDTHIHADHLSGVREICSLTGAKPMMHRSTPIADDFTPLDDGAELNLSGLEVKVLHTPGHAPEHISLLVDNRFLLSGDTLLIRDVGRTDLGRGSNEQLYKSIFERLSLLGDGVEVYPAHIGSQHFLSGELSSTIGIEKHLNPVMQIKSFDEFVHYMTEGWPPKPAHSELYIKVNQGLMTLDEAQNRLQKTALGEA
jgi:glyoxylase-like metal-dependent hydrolase (beta-lactamase superfamily II)